jgi:hypothetical protein
LQTPIEFMQRLRGSATHGARLPATKPVLYSDQVFAGGPVAGSDQARVRYTAVKAS